MTVDRHMRQLLPINNPLICPAWMSGAFTIRDILTEHEFVRILQV